MVPDPKVRYPLLAFSPYDLAPIIDRCINCEKSKKIIAAVTIDHKSGPICVNCFNSNKK